MANSDSFFGFDTRMPEDVERSANGAPGFGNFRFDSLRDMQLEDSSSSPFAQRRDMDPWSSTSMELDKMDTRELYMNMGNSNDQYGFDTAMVSSSSTGTGDGDKWRSSQSPGIMDRDVDDSLSDTLARLVDDDSSSSPVGSRAFGKSDMEDMGAGLTSASARPLLNSDSRNPWSGPNSVSSFGSNSTWSGVAGPSGYPPPQQQSLDTGFPFGSRQEPSPSPQPPIVRKPMTLTELEDMMLRMQTGQSSGAAESSSADRYPAPTENSSYGRSGPLRSIDNLNYNAAGVRSPVPSPGIDPRFAESSAFNMLDPNMNQRGDGMRYGPQGQQRFQQGMGPRQGMHPNMRQPFQPHPSYQTRVFENASQMNMLRMQNGGMPPRAGQQWMGPGMRGPRPVQNQRFLPPRMMHPQNRYYNPNQQYYDPENGDGEDENNGWMTEREKEWVIKVQQSQVKTDNPYLDDYYYYVRSMKKSMKSTGRVDSEQDFIFPARAAPEPKEERQNMFEGSLGKVCISSVFNPRRTVDVDPTEIAKSRGPASQKPRRWFVDPLQKEKGYAKTSLLSIEELYKLILELQDYQREMAALPEAQKEQSEETRRNIVNLVFDKLIQGASPDTRVRSFCDTLKVRKGRELIKRALQVLFKEQIVVLAGYFVRAVPVLIGAAVDKHEGFIKCLSSVGESLKSTNFRRLVEMVLPLLDEKSGLADAAFGGPIILAQAVKNQFTLNLLALLVANGERSYDLEWAALDEEEQEKWTLFITYFLISLSKVPSSEVPPVMDMSVSSAVGTHIGRFPFSQDQVETCREKLRQLTA